MNSPQIPVLLALAAACALGLAGCAPSQRGTDPFDGIDRADEYVASSSGRRIESAPAAAPVTIAGSGIGWDELIPRLSEAAGSLVIEEIALERALEAELARRGTRITETAIADERAWLGASVVQSAGNAANSDDLVYQVRLRRGLGRVRFESLLRRNAMLRALVGDRVQVTEQQIELAWRVRHGEKLRVRLLVAPTERDAQALVRDALSSASTELRFAELALQHSTDASAARGGLIEPFSPADPAYEQSIRTAASSLEPGQIGPVVAIGGGFAAVYLVERVPADGVALAQARPGLEAELRRRQERLLMDELATQLLAEARVRVLDESLNWSVRAGQER